MQKIRKFLRAASEKTALPTNQPTVTNKTDLIGPRWRRSKKKQTTKRNRTRIASRLCQLKFRTYSTFFNWIIVFCLLLISQLCKILLWALDVAVQICFLKTYCAPMFHFYTLWKRQKICILELPTNSPIFAKSFQNSLFLASYILDYSEIFTC